MYSRFVCVFHSSQKDQIYSLGKWLRYPHELSLAVLTEICRTLADVEKYSAPLRKFKTAMVTEWIKAEVAMKASAVQWCPAVTEHLLQQ